MDYHCFPAGLHKAGPDTCVRKVMGMHLPVSMMILQFFYSLLVGPWSLINRPMRKKKKKERKKTRLRS